MSGPAWSRDDLLEFSRGYHGMAVLAAAADLDLFTPLARARRSAAELSAELACDPRGLTILLDALVALGLLTKTAERYDCAGGIGTLLSSEGPDSILPMIRHQGTCLRRWAQLSSVVKTGRPAPRLPSVAGEDADRAAFIGGMHVLAEPTADRLLAEIGPVRFRHLLDVGGASGTWTLAFLRACPEGRATIFDLPAVLPEAERRIALAGLRDRVALAGGDYLQTPLPPEADLAWVSAIVHQNSREQNRRLFGSLHEALVAGGRLLIRDVVMDPGRVTPPAGALFAVNMLVATEGGGTFTFEELREDLEACGFAEVRLLRRDEAMNSIVAASRPGS